MNREPNGPRDPKNKKVGNVDRPERIGDIQPDTTPRREGLEFSDCVQVRSFNNVFIKPAGDFSFSGWARFQESFHW